MSPFLGAHFEVHAQFFLRLNRALVEVMGG